MRRNLLVAGVQVPAQDRALLIEEVPDQDLQVLIDVFKIRVGATIVFGRDNVGVFTTLRILTNNSL